MVKNALFIVVIKIYITKLPFKFREKFPTADLFNKKQICRNLNLLIKSAVKFKSAVYLVADF